MTKTYRRVPAALLVAALALSVAVAASPSGAAPTEAIIDNGTIQLGIHETGELNVSSDMPSLGGTYEVGLRYLPTNAEGTAPGCLCEGWGVADAISAESGYANQDEGGAFNLTPVSFDVTASTAVSVVRVDDLFEVRHDYHPSASENLYEVRVTITNISSATVTPLYRRVMDWDVEPTAFDEYVTAQTASAANLIYNSSNGFATADPLGDRGEGEGWDEGNYVDAGPDDHGALFDFQFADLAPGASKTFEIYYGAAGTESEADAARAAVGAEVFSYGQTSTDPTGGTPNTFIFGFAGVGESRSCPEDGSETLGGELASKTVHESVEPVVRGLSADNGERVHRVNCTFVTRVEDIVDGAAPGGSARVHGINPANLLR